MGGMSPVLLRMIFCAALGWVVLPLLWISVGMMLMWVHHKMSISERWGETRTLERFLYAILKFIAVMKSIQRLVNFGLIAGIVSGTILLLFGI